MIPTLISLPVYCHKTKCLLVLCPQPHSDKERLGLFSNSFTVGVVSLTTIHIDCKLQVWPQCFHLFDNVEILKVNSGSPQT